MEEWTLEEYGRYVRGGGQARVEGSQARRKRATASEEEKRFENQLYDELRGAGLCPEREYKFHPKRRWRIDFVLHAYGLAIEVEGGIYSRGRHVRGKGYERDCEKYNEVELAGWRLLRFTTGQVRKGLAMPTILRAIDKIEQERRNHGI